jgi:hypothetical protein
MDLREIGLDSTVSGQGPVAGCCECGDEPSGSCATELVSFTKIYVLSPIAFICQVSMIALFFLSDNPIDKPIVL